MRSWVNFVEIIDENILEIIEQRRLVLKSTSNFTHKSILQTVDGHRVNVNTSDNDKHWSSSIRSLELDDILGNFHTLT